MSALARFAALVEGGEAEIDLGLAALLMSAVEYPHLDVARYWAELDDIGRRLARRLDGRGTPLEAATVAADLIFGELGFAGNTNDYYDPKNSYLSDVMYRRLGIPITLSVVFMEVCKRASLGVQGVGMPGHFLVRLRDDADVLLDPFEGGRVVSAVDCAARLRTIYGAEARLSPSMLASVSPRAMLFRMLTNLKHAYLGLGDSGRALRTIDQLLLVEPSAAAEYRDRALVWFRAGDHRRAAADLRRYLALQPGEADAAWAHGQLRTIEQLADRRN